MKYLSAVRGLLICLPILIFADNLASAQDSVGKWRRYELTLTNNSYSGNPFELELDATFTHAASGAEITLPGYYAGNDVWKVGFMPTLTGDWNYETFSADPDLNGIQGSVLAVESGHRGMLGADPKNPRKWKYTDGPYVVPIGLRLDLFNEDASTADFIEAADFLANEVNGSYYEGTLRNDVYLNVQAHEFDLARWDRLEERMEILTERGLGYQVMFYSDDSETPEWSGMSDTERLLIRYTVARLASFPVVWFNTGIDIVEYRDGNWIDWFGEQIRSLDPYGHPVSSRYGGGSGDDVMAGQIWDSRGERLAIIQEMIEYFEIASVPVSMDDAWGENRPSHPDKNFSPEDIRRAFWKCVAAGGVGGLVRGSDYWYSIDGGNGVGRIQEDLESEQWLKLVNPFVESELGSLFGTMVPQASLASNAYALADPAQLRILYFVMGRNDSWDNGTGGDITVNLSTSSGLYEASWFDTRTGNKSSAGVFVGGQEHSVSPPNDDDWILLLSSQENVTVPRAPTDLRAE